MIGIGLGISVHASGKPPVPPIEATMASVASVQSSAVGGSVLPEISVAPTSVWRLDESSGTLAEDSVGSADGTHTSVTTGVAGRCRKAATYDGTGETSCGDVYNIEADVAFSFAGWVKTDNLSASRTIAGRSQVTDQKGYRFASDISGGIRHLNLHIRADGTNRIFVRAAATNIATGDWVHVACTYTGNRLVSGCTFYVNGAALGAHAFTTDNLSTASILNTGPFAIGGDGAITQGQWIGELDDLAFWNGTALTATDIENIYDAGLLGVSVADLPIT